MEPPLQAVYFTWCCQQEHPAGPQMDGVPHLGRREYTIKAEELGHTLLGHGTQESHSSSSSIKFTQKTQIASSIAARLL
jgi:hypothetical protein